MKSSTEQLFAAEMVAPGSTSDLLSDREYEREAVEALRVALIETEDRRYRGHQNDDPKNYGICAVLDWLNERGAYKRSVHNFMISDLIGRMNDWTPEVLRSVIERSRLEPKPISAPDPRN